MPENNSCEICGTQLREKQLSECCTLEECPNCFHVRRDLERCNANAREHAWGGSGFMDKVRCSLTMWRLKRLVPRKKILRVFEVGFGTGIMLKKFLRLGHTCRGIEPGFLEEQVDPEVKLHCTLDNGKLEDFGMPDKGFDVVYAIHVVEHFERVQEAFKKCYDLLDEHGVFYAVTPSASSKGLSIFKDAWWNLEDPTHLKFFSPQSLKLALEKAGFSTVKTNIPIVDSLAVEANSFLRKFKKGDAKHGIISSGYSKVLYLFLIPVFILARMFNSRLAPSVEVVAYK